MCFAKYDVMLSLKLGRDQLETFISLRHFQNETWTDPFWSGSPDAKGIMILRSPALSSITTRSQQLHQWPHTPPSDKTGTTTGCPTQFSTTEIHIKTRLRSLLAKQVVFEESVVQLLPRSGKNKRNLKLSTELIKRVENLRADVSSVRFVSYKT